MKKLLIVLLVLGLLLRLGGIGNALYQDEAVWGFTIRDSASYAEVTESVPHPPIAIQVFRFITLPFGVTTESMRLVPLIFSVLNIFLVYKLSKEHFGERSGYWAALLMVFGFWNYIASLQIDMEGSILTFMFLITFMSYLQYMKGKEKSMLYLTSVLFGLTMLTKFTGVLVLVIIALHNLIERKNFAFSVKDLIPIAGIGGGIFLLWYGWTYFFNQTVFLRIFGHGTRSLYQAGESFFSLLPLVYFVLWATVLLTLLLCYSFFRYKKKYVFYYLWIAVPIVFYFFIGKNFIATYDRYLMIVIPALAVIGGDVIDSFKLEKRQSAMGIILFLLGLLGVGFLNLWGERVVHSIPAYFNQVLSMQWNFLFPLTSSTGPTIVVNFLTLALFFILGGILMVLAYTSKDIRGKDYFVAFLAIGFALNVFLIIEQVHPFTQPNISDGIYGIYTYVEENGISPPLVTNMFETTFYMDIDPTQDSSGFHYLSSKEEIDTVMEQALIDKATILFLDYPLISKESYLWNSMNKCELIHTEVSKDIKTGYIFSC